MDMKSTKPQPGEYWKTRDGRVVGPLGLNHGAGTPWTLAAEIAGMRHIWTASGFYLPGQEPHGLDLIERVEAPAPAETSGAHPDDTAVDAFATVMKEKLRYSRDVKGRGGWADPNQCGQEYLSRLLVEHVGKGDPVDVANLAMMLHQRGERIVTTGTEGDVAGLIEELNKGTGFRPIAPETSEKAAQALLTLQQERDAAHKAADWNMSVVHDRDKEIAALQQKNKELEESLEQAAKGEAEYTREWTLAMSRLTTSQTECERLRKALEPFAKAADLYSGEDDAGFFQDDYPVIDNIAVGDYRRARAALQPKEEGR